MFAFPPSDDKHNTHDNWIEYFLSKYNIEYLEFAAFMLCYTQDDANAEGGMYCTIHFLPHPLFSLSMSLFLLQQNIDNKKYNYYTQKIQQYNNKKTNLLERKTNCISFDIFCLILFIHLCYFIKCCNLSYFNRISLICWPKTKCKEFEEFYF